MDYGPIGVLWYWIWFTFTEEVRAFNWLISGSSLF